MDNRSNLCGKNKVTYGVDKDDCNGGRENLSLRIGGRTNWGTVGIKVLMMYLWWSLCPLYLHACQVSIAIGNSGLCCCVCVTSFER